MVDLLAQGAAWLSGKLGGHAAHSVTYKRGIESVAVDVGVGTTAFRIDQDGVWIRVETRDFLCDPADLGTFGLPKRGDLIIETITGVPATYEVVGPGGEPEWRWSGPTRDRIRIHTLRISAPA